MKLTDYSFDLRKIIEESIHEEFIGLIEQDLDLGGTDNPEGDSEAIEDIDEEEVEEGEADEDSESEEGADEEEGDDSGEEGESPDEPEEEEEVPTDPTQAIIDDLNSSLELTDNPQDLLKLAKASIQNYFSSHSEIDPLINRLQNETNPILNNVGQRLSLFAKGR